MPKWSKILLINGADKIYKPFLQWLIEVNFFHGRDEWRTIKQIANRFAMDYQWRITPMVAAQIGQLPGRNYTTLNVVAGIHTLHPSGGIRQTVKAFCEKYQNHICKEVHYYFDHTAV